ncbi:MAG: CE1759 family FMN reductase, partial [Janthinobacterium lividum]
PADRPGRDRRHADLAGSCGMTRRIVVLSAGLSQPSSSRLLGDRLAAAAARALRAEGEQVEVEVVELREFAVDLAHQLVTGFPGASLSAVLDRVAAADGVVAVSPVFNASYSGLFKMFVDALPVGTLDGVPVLLGATGGSARHSLVVEHALRPLFAYLRATTTSTGVFAATEDWASPGELDARVERAGQELAVLVAGSGRGRPAAVDPYDPSTFGFARFSEPLSA